MSTQKTVRLTDTRVRDIRPGKGVSRVFDSVVLGFHIRVTAKGHKAYAVTFQRSTGTKVHVTIGSTEVWSAETAREQARKLREIHDAGKDARVFMQTERHAQDLNALVDLWRESYRHLLKATTQKGHESVLKNVILPALGSRLVKDLDRASITALYRKEQKAHPTQANRMIEIMGRLMTIAEMEGWRPLQSNPCYRFPKAKLLTCPRVLTAVELGRMEAAMVHLEGLGKLDQIASDMIRLIAVSGLRSGEAANLRWTDIDLDAGTMRFGDHKTARTAGVKVLPLNGPIRAILARRASAGLGTKLVFPGLVKDKPIQGLGKMWDRVKGVEGCELGDATPHDLRRTFMSVTVELGYPPAIGDTLLGHSLGKITDTYTRLSMEGILANASEDAALWIAAAMRGEAPKHGAKVTAGQNAKAMA